MRNLLIISGLLLFFSCTNNKSEESVDVQDTTETGTTDINLIADIHRLIWDVEFDTIKNDFVLKQHRKVNRDTLTPEKLIKELNSVSSIYLVFRKISNDTIYVAIPDSESLTQTMGTTGANIYISTTTYNLTELKGIKYVNYDFKEGDHLSPGTMSREDFKTSIN